MTETVPRSGRRTRRRGGGAVNSSTSERNVDYHFLKNPFTPQTVFSEDRIEAIHSTALQVLQELGIKVLLPEARDIFRTAGATVDDETEMVFIGRDIIESAVSMAPRSFKLHGGTAKRDLQMELGTLAFQSGAGAPNATDRIRRRRPGSLQDATELTKMVQHFDAIQMLSPGVEPQDVPPNLRHYAFTHAQLTHSDKIPFIFSRGSKQVEECFEMKSVV